MIVFNRLFKRTLKTQTVFYKQKRWPTNNNSCSTSTVKTRQMTCVHVVAVNLECHRVICDARLPSNGASTKPNVLSDVEVLMDMADVLCGVIYFKRPLRFNGGRI